MNSLFTLLWRWRARQFRQSPSLPVVLLYHSVNLRSRDPLKLSITPQRFEEHLKWLRNHCTVLPLTDFVSRRASDTLPTNAVSITFDDGYADNVELATPLLEKYGLTATVFAATDYVEGAIEGWWDELDAIFLETHKLPERFVHGAFACEVETMLDPARRDWTVLEPAQTARELAFLAASDFVKRLDRDRRIAFMNSLRRWSGRGESSREHCRLAGWDALRGATETGVLAVGAHTKSHPCLAALSEHQQFEEISGSAAIVEQKLGRRPAGLAYPFGTYHDFSPVTLRVAKKAGLPFALANMPARLGPRRFDIPRLLVWDWTCDELARRLGR